MEDFNTTVDSSGHLTTDAGLRTRVLLALFTDRRADPEDAVPDASDLRGWWGDSYPEVDGDADGSKLWLLQGMKAGPAAIEFAKAEAAAALQFLIDDGVASEITVEAEIQRGAIMAMRVGIQRPNDPGVLWLPLWDITLAGG